MIQIFRFAIVVCLLLESAVLAQTTAATSQPYTRREDVIYGRMHGTALTLDVFKPTGKRNGTIVVFAVSGGWVSRHESISLPIINMFILPFLERGYVVCAVVHGSQPKFTIPEAAANMDRAVKFVRANAAVSGLDPDFIGIVGGSAGGHLSLLQSVNGSSADLKSADPVERASGRVQAVAAIMPPTDFLNWGEPKKLVTSASNIGPFLAAFDFRELDDKSKRFVAVSKKRNLEILREISPIYHVSRETPPTLIIHGDLDTLVPIQQAQTHIARLKEAGVQAELVVKKDAGHGWLPMSPDVERCAEWFDRYLLGKARK